MKTLNELSPSIDVAVLAAQVGSDPAVLRDLLNEFGRSARAVVAELMRASAGGQVERVRALAHKLTSSAYAVGACALGQLCVELAVLAASEQRTRVQELAGRLAAEMGQVELALAAADAALKETTL
jgi:HPt (histidine-containing phosphotransfer) domain-containing protein